MSIDRIRQDIRQRLDQLEDEVGRLRDALAELSDEGPRTAALRAATGGRPRRRPGTRDGRSAAGRTRSAILDHLTHADRPQTAAQVARATGLGRASVSTTLSKLSRAGEISKAARGYALDRGTNAP